MTTEARPLRLYPTSYGGILFSKGNSTLFFLDKEATEKVLRGEFVPDGFYFDGVSHASSIAYRITSACPYNCLYCSQGEVRSGTRVNALNTIRRLNPFKVSLTGGEPTTVTGIEKVIKSILETSEVNVVTTGYKLLPPMEDVKVNVSLDSNIKSVHEKTRPGTWEKSMRALDYYHELGMLGGVNTVVTKFNKDHLYELGSFLSDYDGIKWNVSLVQDFGKARNKGLGIEPEEYARLLLDLEKRFPFVTRMLSDGKKLMVRESGCWLKGRPKSLFMTEDGILVPCLESYNYGIEENFRKTSLSRIRECNSCEYRFVCGGGCRANAMINGEGPLARDKPFCRMFKEYVKGKRIPKKYLLPKKFNFDVPAFERKVKELYPEFKGVLRLKNVIRDSRTILYLAWEDTVFNSGNRIVKILVENVKRFKQVRDFAIAWYVDILLVYGFGEIVAPLLEFNDPLFKRLEEVNNQFASINTPEVNSALEKTLKIRKGESLSEKIYEYLSEEGVEWKRLGD